MLLAGLVVFVYTVVSLVLPLLDAWLHERLNVPVGRRWQLYRHADFPFADGIRKSAAPLSLGQLIIYKERISD